MKKRSCLLIILIALSATCRTYSQELPRKLEEAAAHHKEYRFSQAIGIYRSILEQRPDSTLTTEADSLLNMEIQKSLVTSENGNNMLLFASAPAPVTKKVFPAEKFFLRYPGFEEGSWMLPPAEFVKEAQGNPFNVMNMPQESSEIVFSAQDESGAWNIMYTRKLNDTLWSAPQILNENITTAGNEILPHLSPDGKTLYFSSDGHSGMGGYDLYMSKWNEETGDWDTAQNLGFPYSSTGNDYLCYNTPDSFFTILASDRETQQGELTLYITRYEALPLKNEVSQEDAPALATLAGARQQEESPAGSRKETESASEDEGYAEYSQAVKEVRELQDRLKRSVAQLDKRREEYAITTDSLQRVKQEQHILSLEADLLALTQSTTSAVAKLQKIEMDFLSKGIIIAQMMETEEEEAAGSAPDMPPMEFEFAENSMGQTPAFNFEVVVPAVDLSFKIAEESVVADLSELPGGLVYHIQLMTTNRPAAAKSFKGLTPVFERKLSSGKYTYSAGVFSTYAEALKNLNTVRKRGFPTALITAYSNGKSISTRNARIMEKQDNSIYRVTIAGYDTLPAEALSAIRENTTKDIAKAAIDGVMKFVIGPFTNKAQADALAGAISARGVAAEVEKVAN
ncbi:MAG: PD40 domain-containing protein [Bacteroidales bacterium]|nr:PD40 domain-containing protein [Bacteroidales bacterium]